MNRKPKILLFALILAAILIGVAFAATFVSWQQTLTVPAAQAQVSLVDNSPSGGTISGSSDLSSYWTWTGTYFTMTITIYNTGSSTFLPVITSNVPTGAFTTSTINALTAGTHEDVTLYWTPPNVNAGTSSGAFTISVGT